MKHTLIYSLDKHPKSCDSCRMNGQADHSSPGKKKEISFGHLPELLSGKPARDTRQKRTEKHVKR